MLIPHFLTKSDCKAISAVFLLLFSGCAGKDDVPLPRVSRGGGAYTNAWSQTSENQQEVKRSSADLLADSRYDYRKKQTVVTPLADGGYHVAVGSENTVTFDASGVGTGSPNASKEDLQAAASALTEYKQRNQLGNVSAATFGNSKR